MSHVYQRLYLLNKTKNVFNCMREKNTYLHESSYSSCNSSRLGEVNDRLGKIWERQVLKTFLCETMDMDIAPVVSDGD